MTHRTTIENAFYVHDHDLFHAELKKLLADKERLDFLESKRQKAIEKEFQTHAIYFDAIKTKLTVREQLDRARGA